MRIQLFPCVAMLWLLVACCQHHAKGLPLLQQENVLNVKGRELAIGDFDEFNELLEGAMIKLPDATVDMNAIYVDMTNVRCTDFSVDDIIVKAFQDGNSGSTRLQVSIEGLDMVCFLNYKYTFLFTRYGTADLYSYDNRASVEMVFESPNYNGGTFNPTQSSVTQCFPQVNIANLNFHGDISAVVLNTVERLLRDKVEQEANDRICQELRALSQTLVTDTLKGVDRTLKEYISAPPVDPLRSENELIVPDNVTIVDFQDKNDGTWKQWLDQMLVDAVAFLTKPVEGVFGDDMNINKLIRDNFLDEDGAFLVDDEGGLTLYQGHDKFLRTLIVLDTVKIYGLDTIESFAPLEDIGGHTLQNELSFRYLTMEADIIIGAKPSTKPDSIFVNPQAARGDIAERVTIKFGVKNLKAVASVLLAVDEARLGDVKIGALLDTENIFSCFLSTLHGVQIPGLSVEVSDMQQPTLEGFVSPGIDRVISSSVDAAFQMYKDGMLEAAPGFFQIAVTDFLNKMFSEKFPVNASVDSQCSPPAFEVADSGYLDFRDLLLAPDDAKELGGLGTSPYGDVVYTLVTELKEQFLSNSSDGTLKVNALIREFLAESSTNTTGAMAYYDGDLLNSTTSLAMGGFKGSLDFRIFDAHVENLDTIKAPLQLLQPVKGESNMLNNSVSFGIESKPVRLSAKMLISLSDDANLQIRNEVGVSLDVTYAKIGLLVLLQILEQPFFAVPLRDTLNLNCWLTTILPKTPEAKGIVLEEHTVSVQDLALDIGCVDCSSPNFDALIDMLYSEDTKTKVFNFMDLLLESDYLRIATDGFVETASKQCPHTDAYDPDSSWGDFIKEAFGGFAVLEATRDEKAKYFNVALAAITISLILAFLVVRWIARRKNRARMNTLPSDAIYRLRLKEDEEKEKQAELDAATQSMFRSAQLPRYVRVLVPFVILLTIGLVLVGHLGVLSTVNVVGQFAGEQYAVDEVLEFSFFSAALRTYNNGGVEVAVLLFLFTAVWLTKLITSLALWFIPPQKLSVSRRGTILLWLDVFARLSLPDIFMLLLAIGALMVFIGGANETFVIEGDFFSAKLIVVPGAGFYCIIMGQRITRVTSRYLLDCHQEVIRHATRELKQSDKWMMRASGRTNETWVIEDDEESKVSESARSNSSEQFKDESMGRVDSDYAEASIGPGDRADAGEPESDSSNDGEASRSIRRPIAVVFIALTVISLIVIACVFVPSISIDSKIIWGLLGSGKTFEEAVNEYGMFWMISRILVQSRFVLGSTQDYVGLGCLLAVVIITSLAAPAMKGLSFIRRWHQQRQRPHKEAPRPRRKTEQRAASMPFRTKISSAILRWLRRNEAADEDNDFLPACKMKALEDLEVYIVAFVVACWQLGAAAGYAVHLYCFILESVYDIVVYLGLMEKTSSQCYRVQTSSPLFIFIVFMSFFLLLASFLIQAASQYRKTVTRTAAEMKGIDTHCDGEALSTSATVRISKAVEIPGIKESNRTDTTELTHSGSFSESVDSESNR